jgi:hypothetical protein
MTNTDTGFSTFNWGSLNKYNQKSEWSIAGNDQTHILTFSGVYELPIGPHRKYANANNVASRLLLGGWQVSGVLSYASGTPQMITSNYNPYGNGFNRADIVSGQSIDLNWHNYYKSLGQQSPSPSAFNTAAFALPGYTGGNSPREVAGVRSPFFKNESVALAKHFHFTEGVQAELRMEFFNILNRVQICGADYNIADGPLYFGIVNANGSGGSNPCQNNRPRQGQAFFKISF